MNQSMRESQIASNGQDMFVADHMVGRHAHVHDPSQTPWKACSGWRGLYERWLEDQWLCHNVKDMIYKERTDCSNRE